MGEILSLGLYGLTIPEQTVPKCCAPSSALIPPVRAGGDGEDLCSCVDVLTPISLDCSWFIAPLDTRTKMRLAIKKGQRGGRCWRKWHDAHTGNEAQSTSGWEVGNKMNECPKSDGNNPVRLEEKKVSANQELPFSRQPDLEVFT